MVWFHGRLDIVKPHAETACSYGVRTPPSSSSDLSWRFAVLPPAHPHAPHKPEPAKAAPHLPESRTGPDSCFELAACDWWILGSFAVIQVLTFGLMAKQLGFYLDDWATFCQLHFAPHGFFEVLKSSLADPRMVTRPIQCLYYACTYMVFGDNPPGYHVLRCVIEAAGAAFLYLGASRMLARRAPAALAAVFFLLFPSHDASHYWIGAGLGAGFGATLYLCSFWLAMESVSRRSNAIAALSAAVFLCCAYCYEAFLPMLSLTFFGVFFLHRRACSPLVALQQTLKFLLPSLLIGVSEPVYQRTVVPLFSKVFLSPGTFDLRYAVDVFVQGVGINCGVSGWTFYYDRARDAISTLRITEVWRLLGIAASVFLAVFLSHRSDQKQSSNEGAELAVAERRSSTLAEKLGFLLTDNRAYWVLAFAVVMLCSYLTFAVAKGYTPTLVSMINRVNMGASIATSLLLGLLIAGGSDNRRLRPAGSAAGVFTLSLVLSLFLVLADWGFAPYWVQSHLVQKRIHQAVASRSALFHTGDTILLANTPRYVMWAPVFDGVWDFQSLVWMTLGNRKINGGVVSERLDVKKDEIADNSDGFRCATYKYQGLYLYVPDGDQLIPIHSATEFIKTVGEKGMHFGLSADVLRHWQSTSAK